MFLELSALPGWFQVLGELKVKWSPICYMCDREPLKPILIPEGTRPFLQGGDISTVRGWGRELEVGAWFEQGEPRGRGQPEGG